MKDYQIEKLKRIVEENYKVIADHYSETRKKMLWSGLFDIAEKVADGSGVIDVGCGSGKLLRALKHKKINYLGIDSSRSLLKNAKKQFPGFEFQYGDIMNLEKFGDNYDYVFCIAVLQHIPGRKNRVQAIKNLGKKIHAKGEVIISVWDMHQNKKYRKMIIKNNLLKLIGLNKMGFGDIVFDWKNKEGRAVSKRYYHAYTLEELRKDCIEAGLKMSDIYKKDNNIYTILSF